MPSVESHRLPAVSNVMLSGEANGLTSSVSKPP
jgi:hypothetical protein